MSPNIPSAPATKFHQIKPLRRVAASEFGGRDERRLKRKGHFWARRTLFSAARLRHMTHMLRRTALLGIAALVFAPAAYAQSGPVALEGAARAEALATANRYLNSYSRLQARFTQSSPGGGRAAGTLYIQKPGRMRFEYDPPAQLLVVANGSVVAVRDNELRTTERTPLRATPLNIILGENINLERNSRVLRVSQSGPWQMITVRDRAGQMDGQITLQFNGGTLRSWDVIDATGARTRVTLSNVTEPGSLDAGLFRLPDVVDRPRPGRR
jgi:outer membrane lipoprotein-sorting protein